MRRSCSIVLSLAIGSLLVGCGPTAVRSDSTRHDARLITREDIERSGAVDAFDALKRAGSYLNVSERKPGEIRITERGRSSFLLSPQILLIVDGVTRTSLNVLHDIPAEHVEWIRVLTGAEATPQFGTDASNGVLLIATRIPE